MAEHCKPCQHPEARLLDRLISRGDTLAVLARRFELSEDAISRHRSEHVDKLAFTTQVDPQGLLRDLLAAKADAEATLKAADDPELRLRAVREVRLTAESIAKLTGVFRAMDKKILLPVWARVKQAVISALKDHPEAREAVLRSLEQAQAELDGGE